jgi:hypothetical protein
MVLRRDDPAFVRHFDKGPFNTAEAPHLGHPRSPGRVRGQPRSPPRRRRRDGGPSCCPSSAASLCQSVSACRAQRSRGELSRRRRDEASGRCPASSSRAAASRRRSPTTVSISASLCAGRSKNPISEPTVTLILPSWCPLHGAHGLQQRHHIVPLDVVAHGVLEDLPERFTVVAGEVLRSWFRVIAAPPVVSGPGFDISRAGGVRRRTRRRDAQYAVLDGEYWPIRHNGGCTRAR